MTRWRHSRKGIIEGVIEGDPTREFVHIRVSSEHQLRSAKPGKTIPFEAGELVVVRREFLTELPEEPNS